MNKMEKVMSNNKQLDKMKTNLTVVGNKLNQVHHLSMIKSNKIIESKRYKIANKWMINNNN